MEVIRQENAEVEVIGNRAVRLRSTADFAIQNLPETLAQWNQDCRRSPCSPLGLPGKSSFPQKDTESGVVVIFPALLWGPAIKHSPHF